MKQDEFKNRYLIKLASSVFIVALNTVVQMILPRVFSVEEYGYYTYNLNVFTSVVSLANLSASNAMVSKFAKRNEEIGLVLFYLKFYFVMAAVLNIGIMVLYPFRFMQEAFAGQTLLVVLLGLEAAVVSKLLTDSVGICDAMAVSRFPAAVQIILKLLLTAAVLAGYLAGMLNLLYFYVVQVSFTGIITVVMLAALAAAQQKQYPVRLDHGMGWYSKEYYQYCRPLILSSIFSHMVTILMNWALMKWSGAAEQAMFGAAWQLNTLVSYVFSPYAELSRREFAVAGGDIGLLQKRYVQALKMMMWMTSYFSIFIAFTAEWILPVVYGRQYQEAVIVTVLIMFYTIYQSWGQISGSFLLAIEKTRVSAAVTMFAQVCMAICMFLFQIPNRIWPESLGSVGIALTYLISNLAGVSVTLFANSRMLHISFWKNTGIQFVPVILCSGTILLLRQVLNGIWTGHTVGSCIGKIAASGVVYTFAVGSVVWKKPQLLGLTKEGLRKCLKL